MPQAERQHTPLPEGFAGFAFDNRYARLPSQFYARVDPTPVRRPGLLKINHALADELGLDPAALESPEGIALFAGNCVPPGAEPLAQAYAGHQFGHFSAQLGDGRAILLGEIVDRQGRLRDIQLKGSGPTPFSRRGDGRAAVGPVVREYIVSEAMHALGIKSTRALAAVTTGEDVYRETVLPGAVLTRVAASHLRIGTFEFFRGRDDAESITALADFAIERHYPEVAQADNPYIALLDAVIEAQASLVASWLSVGFIHGVMNTDNMSISGETIDYGPCAFMDQFDPGTVFSSIDSAGRYAYGNQPNIALWNLSRLAECLLHLFDEDSDTAVSQAEQQLSNFTELFDRHWMNAMRRKLGLVDKYPSDSALITDFLHLMQRNEADYTLSFRYLSDSVSADGNRLNQLFRNDITGLHEWLQRWRERLALESTPVHQLAESLRQANPAYIPRNHRVEAAIRAAVDENDYGPFHEMVAVLNRPYEEQPGRELYAEPPQPGEAVLQTFCGT